MNTKLLSSLIAVVAAALVLAGPAAADPAASTTLISAPSGLGGLPAAGTNHSQGMTMQSVSGDGCRIVFTSTSDGLATVAVTIAPDVGGSVRRTLRVR